MTNTSLKTKLIIITSLLIISLFYTYTVIDKNREQYISSFPSDNYFRYRIGIAITNYSGNVGNEWEYTHYLNGKPIHDKEIVTIKASDGIIITSKCVEHDTYNDTGSTSSNKYSFLKSKNYQHPLEITNLVTVTENEGRYKGSIAKITCKYTLTRMLPSGKTFINLLTDEKYDYVGTGKIALLLSSSTMLLFAYFIIKLLETKKAQRQAQTDAAAERQRRQKEQFEKSRQERIARALTIAKQSGQINEDGSPNVGTITSEKPFGQWTVYITHQGNCYHKSVECCKAQQPICIYRAKAMGYYNCSRCLKYEPIDQVPDWFNTLYTEGYEPIVNLINRSNKKDNHTSSRVSI